MKTKITNMVTTSTILILVVLLPYTCALGQNPECVKYIAPEGVTTIVINGDHAWAGTLIGGMYLR